MTARTPTGALSTSPTPNGPPSPLASRAASSTTDLGRSRINGAVETLRRSLYSKYNFMHKHLYIIPGLGDTPHEPSYEAIASDARKLGYTTHPISIDWGKPLSQQKFKVEDNATIFGFSLGALLAHLIAQESPTDHIILASMTPFYSFTDPEIKQALVELLGKDFVEDLEQNLKEDTQAQKVTTMYGVHEDEEADVLVPDTEHELTETYIESITKLLA